VTLTLPNAQVAAQAEAHLRSTFAMATMQFQWIAKETSSSGKSWEGFTPEEAQAQTSSNMAEAVPPTPEPARARCPLGEEGTGQKPYSLPWGNPPYANIRNRWRSIQLPFPSFTW
jgi:hypothetical protein